MKVFALICIIGLIYLSYQYAYDAGYKAGFNRANTKWQETCRLEVK